MAAPNPDLFGRPTGDRRGWRSAAPADNPNSNETKGRRFDFAQPEGRLAGRSDLSGGVRCRSVARFCGAKLQDRSQVPQTCSEASCVISCHRFSCVDVPFRFQPQGTERFGKAHPGLFEGVWAPHCRIKVLSGPCQGTSNRCESATSGEEANHGESSIRGRPPHLEGNEAGGTDQSGQSCGSGTREDG